MLCEEEVGQSETHDTATLWPHASSDASPVLPLPTGQDVDCETQPIITQAGMTSISRAPCRCTLRCSCHSSAFN
jgi:hypothetical protein